MASAVSVLPVVVGVVENTKVLTAPGFTVIVALLALVIATDEIFAPKVTEPDRTARKLEVKTPDPASVIAPKVPVPPTLLEVNAIDPNAGKPDGFKLP